MQAIRPLARQIPRAASKSIRQTPRRFASHGHDHHAGPSHTVNESFGTATYLTFAAVPVGYILYLFSTSTEGWVIRLIKYYEESKDQVIRRNARHAATLEQAADDRALFAGEAEVDHVKGVEFRNSEIFNSGSPFNIPAGQGPINLDKVMEKYWKQNQDMEKLKASRLEKRAQGRAVPPLDAPKDPIERSAESHSSDSI